MVEITDKLWLRFLFPSNGCRKGGRDHCSKKNYYPITNSKLKLTYFISKRNLISKSLEKKKKKKKTAPSIIICIIMWRSLTRVAGSLILVFKG